MGPATVQWWLVVVWSLWQPCGGLGWPVVAWCGLGSVVACCDLGRGAGVAWGGLVWPGVACGGLVWVGVAWGGLVWLWVA